MFHVGQKVECIDESDQDLLDGDTHVSKGAFYHIREAFNHWQGQAVRVDEILNPLDRAYCASRFRAVVDTKTDISVFTALLNPSPQKVRESIGYDLGFTAEEIGLS